MDVMKRFGVRVDDDGHYRIGAYRISPSGEVSVTDEDFERQMAKYLHIEDGDVGFAADRMGADAAAAREFAAIIAGEERDGD